MTLILDSSEICAAIKLAAELIPADNEVAAADIDDKELSAVQESVPPQQRTTASTDEINVDSKYRGDRLEQVIENMCQRSGFIGAIIADSQGLPLAIVNPPVSEEAIAAFTSVLGDALKRAGSLLGQHGAEYLAMDINYQDKIVLRQFQIEATSYSLMVICPQEVDERSEIELSIEQVVAILTDN